MEGWQHEGRLVIDPPKGAIGFIYKITHEDTKKFYVGRKALYSITNPEISRKKYDELRKAGEPVTKTKDRKRSTRGNTVWRYKRKQVRKETNWKSYFGSCKDPEMVQAIERGDRFNREILKWCYDRKEMTYRELEAIVKHNCLDDCNCWNGNLMGKFFPFVDCK